MKERLSVFCLRTSFYVFFFILFDQIFTFLCVVLSLGIIICTMEVMAGFTLHLYYHRKDMSLIWGHIYHCVIFL
jgi:hypothetical protein